MNHTIPVATHKNQRRCAVCRRLANKSDFWRIVRTFPDRTVSLDVGMGRSAYLCKTEVCLKNAERKDRLSRSLKAPVPSVIYQSLRQSLTTEPAPLCSENATIEIGIL